MIALDVVFFATADAPWVNVIDAYIGGAAYHFANFDLALSSYPARPADPIPLPLVGAVYDRVPDNGIGLLAGDVRLAASVALPAGRGIPVIFCRFQRSSNAAVTILRGDSGVNRDVDWLTYILINPEVLNAQREVLAHELIHAANYSGDIDRWGDIYLHDSDPTSIMRPRGAGGGVVAMQERHAIALRQAYFARPI